MLSKSVILEIRKRCQAATPGPWKASIEGRDHDSGSDVIVTGGNDFEITGASAADYDFIANARQDIPILLDELESLKRLLAERGPVDR